jgi:hypothetical protein
MGINFSQKSNKIYVRLFDGRLGMESTQDDPSAERIEVKNPQSGQILTKYVRHIFSITGIITDVKVVTREFKDTKVKPFKEILVSIKDGNEDIVLQVKFKTEQGISLVNRLTGLVRLNLGSFPVTIGSYKMQNMESKRFNQGFYIHFGDNFKVDLAYKRESMPKDIQWKQVTRNGELEWDKTEYLRFFMGLLENEVIPYYENLKKLNATIPQEDSFEDVEDVF